MTNALLELLSELKQSVFGLYLFIPKEGAIDVFRIGHTGKYILVPGGTPPFELGLKFFY